ncbi:hypothetical protein HH299_18685, partial [Xanthomonas sp. Kuri4-2]
AATRVLAGGRRTPGRTAHQGAAAVRLPPRHGRLVAGDQVIAGLFLGDGRLTVVPNPADASHLLRGAADSNALIVLPEGSRRFEAGEVLAVVPYAMA